MNTFNFKQARGDEDYIRRPDPINPNVEFEPTREETLAHSPGWRKANPELAALNAYQHKYNTDTLGGIVGGYLPGLSQVLSPLTGALNRTMDHGPVVGAGVGALAGAGIGKLLGATGALGDIDPTIPLSLLGGLGGGYLSHVRNSTKMSNMNTTADAATLGATMATLHSGHSMAELKIAAARQNTLHKMEEGAGVLNKLACGIAATALNVAGEAHNLLYHMYVKMANAPTWNPIFNPYADVVIEILGEENILKSDRDHKHSCEFVKMNSWAPSLFAPLITTTASAAPGLAEAALSTAAIAGGGLGALAWLVNRNAREDSTDVEILRQKLEHYKSLAKDVKIRIKARNLDPESTLDNALRD